MRDDPHPVPGRRRSAGDERPGTGGSDRHGVKGRGALPSGDEGDGDAPGREDDEQQWNADGQ